MRSDCRRHPSAAEVNAIGLWTLDVLRHNAPHVAVRNLQPVRICVNHHRMNQQFHPSILGGEVILLQEPGRPRIEHATRCVLDFRRELGLGQNKEQPEGRLLVARRDELLDQGARGRHA
eukprot:7259750-Pyramimonas_sp.AAC.2